MVFLKTYVSFQCFSGLKTTIILYYTDMLRHKFPDFSEKTDF